MAIHSEYISPQFASSQKNEMKKELCDTDEDVHPFSNSIFNNRQTRGKETEEIEIEHEYSYEHGKVHKKLHGSERRQRRRAKESDRQDLGHRYRNDTEKHDDEKEDEEEEEEEKEEKEERRYNIYNSLSVKEMSDEEISSENEYNRKLKKKENFFLNDKKEKPSTSSTTSTSTSSLISNDVINYLNDTTKLNEEFQRKKNKWNYNILSDSENKYFNSEELKYKKEDGIGSGIGSGNSNNMNRNKNTTTTTNGNNNNNNSNNNNNNVTNGNFDNNVKNNEPMNNIFSQLIVNKNTQPQKEKISHNVDEWINKLFKCELLHSEEIKLMCELLIDILKEEENCVQVRVPVTVAGDIHGQFYDLLELFHIGGLPPDVNYLFLGDYVDRGYYSCECFCLVACFKIKYPSNVTLLRGNHESRQITKVYGFYDECMRKYSNDNNVWKYLTDAFDYLPLTAIINNKIFCDHGGISPHLKTIEDINKLNRFNEVPQDGAICDLLWSDPAGPEEETFDGWRPSPRGAGVLFSENVTATFLRKNDLCYICRAHQLVQDGYQWMHNDKVVTIFSAPNYCYRCGNCASLMFVDELMEKQFITFNTAPLRASAQTLRRNVDFMF